jgi:hypothetical protein
MPIVFNFRRRTIGGANKKAGILDQISIRRNPATGDLKALTVYHNRNTLEKLTRRAKPAPSGSMVGNAE